MCPARVSDHLLLHGGKLLEETRDLLSLSGFVVTEGLYQHSQGTAALVEEALQQISDLGNYRLIMV